MLDEHTIDDLLDFVSDLAETLHKPVVVTPENSRRLAIFRCEPDGRGPIYLPQH
ncbi:MAG: hypothetical protein HOV81_12550 [Kofleriaceae bacterium]|nr:hypothetical protein [Kofleriaceae bacterium]